MPASIQPSPPAYRAAYLLALGIIGLLVLAGQALTRAHLVDMEQDSLAVNQAGRQRMFYLTISRSCLELAGPAEPAARQTAAQLLRQSLETWRAAHQGLTGQEPGWVPGGRNSTGAWALLGAMEPPRLAVVQAAEQVLAMHAAGQVGPVLAGLAADIQSQGDEYLDLMDRLVRLYDQEARERVRELVRLEWLLTAAILAGLVAVGLFIFRPMNRRIRQDRLELEQAAKAFEALSLTDGLTGLANRRGLDRGLAEQWRRAWNQGEPLALLMLDLDHFKNYNDTYGHQEGDRVLRAVANLLKEAVRRPSDLAARYGGEEMVALLPGTGLEGAKALAEELRRRVEGLALPHAASQAAPVVTVSLGVAAAFPRPGSRPRELLRAADQALYQAKAAGRNQVRWQELDLGTGSAPPASERRSGPPQPGQA